MSHPGQQSGENFLKVTSGMTVSQSKEIEHVVLNPSFISLVAVTSANLPSVSVPQVLPTK